MFFSFWFLPVRMTGCIEARGGRRGPGLSGPLPVNDNDDDDALEASGDDGGQGD